MIEDTATENTRWAHLIIDFLYRQKVEYFCVSPGSRSTALTLALARHPHAKAFVHFDERAVAFHALGYAKATGKPAAVIVTSGTAVANLFPAVMEASLSHVPLILLTADRPPELRNVGANQTVDQVKLFGNYVRFAVDLPCPTSATSASYLSSTIAQSVFISDHSPKGPVHLNCMFREPLFSETKVEPIFHPIPHYTESRSQPSEKLLEEWAKSLAEFEKGVIILGSLPANTAFASIEKLSKKLGWPILPDIFSGFRTNKESIAHYELILKSLPEMRAETILHLGDRLVSKTLLEWLQSGKMERAFQVLDTPSRSDPLHLITDRVQCDPALFCTSLLPYLEEKESTWIDEWTFYDHKAEAALSEFFENEEQLSEPSLFFYLQNALGKEAALFLGNSMPVRDAQLFLGQKEGGPIFGNRGVSGIDGNIATSVGIAQGLRMPVVSVIGDLATLHDLNSLAQMKKADYPVVLIVVNNHGGGIFSFLPIAKKQDVFEEFFATSHNLSFEMAAKLFDLPYLNIQNGPAFTEFLKRPLHTSCIIEINTDRQENFLLHQQLYQKVKECLQHEAEIPSVLYTGS